MISGFVLTRICLRDKDLGIPLSFQKGSPASKELIFSETDLSTVDLNNKDLVEFTVIGHGTLRIH